MLQHTVDGFGRVNLYDATDAADIDAQFQAGGAHQTGKNTFAQLVFHLLTRFGGQRTVVNPNLEVGRHRLKTGGEGFRIASTVHEHQTGRLRSEDMAQVPISSVLFGTQSGIDRPDLILREGHR